jgi:hypothetical protein
MCVKLPQPWNASVTVNVLYVCVPIYYNQEPTTCLAHSEEAVCNDGDQPFSIGSYCAVVF